MLSYNGQERDIQHVDPTEEDQRLEGMETHITIPLLEDEKKQSREPAERVAENSSEARIVKRWRGLNLLPLSAIR